MDPAEHHELKRLVATMYLAVRAGPYDDAATDKILNFYPPILRFWNRRFARHCQLVNAMQNSPARSLDPPDIPSNREKEAYQRYQNRQLSYIAAINAECEAGIIPVLK